MIKENGVFLGFRSVKSVIQSEFESETIGQGGVEDFTVLGAMFIKNHYVALRYDGSSLSVGLGDRTDVKFIE